MKTSGDQVITSVWAWTSGSHCYLILKYALEQMKRKITQSHIFCLKLHQHKLSTPLRELCIATNLSSPPLIMSDWQGHQNPERGLQSTSCTSKWLPVNIKLHLRYKFVYSLQLWLAAGFSIKYQQSSYNTDAYWTVEIQRPVIMSHCVWTASAKTRFRFTRKAASQYGDF